MAILCSTTKKKRDYKYEVYGLEKKDKKGEKIVNALKNNLLPFEVDDKDFKRSFFKIIKKNHFNFGFNQKKLSYSDIIILSINFDINLNTKKINFNNLKEIVRDIASKIKPDSHIIIESTLPPGTTEKIIFPEIKKKFKKRGISSKKIKLSYSFERVTPGNNYLNSIKNMHRVYATMNKEHEKDIQLFLKDILNIKTAKICRLNNTTEAETCKILENTYRALNIAFIEEWRNFSSILNLDLNRILDYIRLRPTHSNIMRPGVGVGGYCLTKDPLFAEISSKYVFKKNIRLPLSNEAVKINSITTKNVILSINKVHNLKLYKNKKVMLFGASYRQGVGDTRFSPSSVIYDYFKKIGAKITVVDPYLDFWNEKKCKIIKKCVSKKDIALAIFLVPHKEFSLIKLNFKSSCFVIDVNNVFSEKKIKEIKKKYKKNYVIGKYN